MDFGQLKARLLSQIGRAPSDLVYELVTADVNNLRLNEMISETTLTGGSPFTLPADFLAVSDAYIDVYPRVGLQSQTTTGLNKRYSIGSHVNMYTIDNGLMHLNPATNEDVQLTYYAGVQVPVSDVYTNDVMTRFPGIYVYGSLTHHAGLIRDMEAAAAWVTGYEASVRAARKSDLSERHSGGIVPVPRGATP